MFQRHKTFQILEKTCEHEEHPFQSNLDNSCFHFVFLFISTRLFFFLNLVFSRFLFLTPLLLPLPRHVPHHETPPQAERQPTQRNSNPTRQRATNTRGSLSLRYVQLAACFSPCVSYSFFTEISDRRDTCNNVTDHSELVKEWYFCTMAVWRVSLLLFRNFLSIIVLKNLNERHASH